MLCIVGRCGYGFNSRSIYVYIFIYTYIQRENSSMCFRCVHIFILILVRLIWAIGVVVSLVGGTGT